ncbi:hypothetical protein TNCV_1078661 [Trichonephila clavipes]|nr:hypothetical protein TNCV_1078661 [Trichonephila clavipes]
MLKDDFSETWKIRHNYWAKELRHVTQAVLITSELNKKYLGRVEPKLISKDDCSVKGSRNYGDRADSPYCFRRHLTVREHTYDTVNKTTT